MNKKIAIIGAGPTGIFTGIFLENFSGEIHLFEKNLDIGEKLKLTGGGRMNIMNKNFSSDHFFSSARSEKEQKSNNRQKNNFFKTPYAQLKNLQKIFSELGIEYFWEENRAILSSQNAKEEVERLKQKITHQQNCTLHLQSEIKNIEKKEKKFLLTIEENREQETITKNEIFDAVIICTGGMFQIKEQANREKTYKIPENLGHSVSKLSPSLSPFRLKYNLLLNSSGISLPTKIFSGKKISEKNGFSQYQTEITDSLLITHFGISGPAVLDFSALWDGKEKVFLNFLPEISPEKFQQQFSEKRRGKNGGLKFLQSYLPSRLAENIWEVLLFEKNKNIADFSKEQEKKLITKVFAFDISKITLPEKFPYPGCWTTKGGVELKDINIATLESKLQKNLFFGGEVLNIDGLCGGYHISFAAICGKIIAKSLLRRL
jgi:predicted Rossmann fold flavoprotein